MSKVIGTKYGIEITKPWNQKMYDWNELVGKLIKIDLYNKLEEFYKKGDKAGMNKIANSFGPSYGDMVMMLMQYSIQYLMILHKFKTINSMMNWNG